jgi:hypothetical protein
MAHSGTVSKRLFVAASSEEEKNMFMGSLIYRTGLDLPMLEQLEKAQRTRYNQIVPFMREKQIEPNFHTPKNYCTFVEDANTADAIVCLLNIALAQDEAVKILQATGTEKALRNGLRPLVFIDKMQLVEWNQSSYEDMVSVTKSALKDLHDGNTAIFVPISSRDGDNFLDSSKKSSWYSVGENRALTVVQAIDC